jgi:CBS domain-containing protein
MSMNTTETSTGIDLNESVESLLAHKGNAVWSISPDSSVFEAIASMSQKGIGALVVVSAGQLVGIVTERDYARKVILMGRQSRETTVREIMTTPVLSVTPARSIGECMQMMTSRRVRHLPVVEGDRAVGIVSIGDLVSAVITAQGETIRQLNNYITGSYPA